MRFLLASLALAGALPCVLAHGAAGAHDHVLHDRAAISCSSTQDCTSAGFKPVSFAHAKCNRARSQCVSECNTGYIASGSSCVKPAASSTKVNLVVEPTQTCKATADCAQTIPANSHRLCSKGTCTFRCNTNYLQSGSSCVRSGSTTTTSAAAAAQTCAKTADCSNTVPTNAHRLCSRSICSWKCNTDYTQSGSGCVRTGVITSSSSAAPVKTTTSSAPAASQTCVKTADCQNDVPTNAHRLCKSGACSWKCNTNYSQSGSGCIRSVTVSSSASSAPPAVESSSAPPSSSTAPPPPTTTSSSESSSIASTSTLGEAVKVTLTSDDSTSTALSPPPTSSSAEVSSSPTSSAAAEASSTTSSEESSTSTSSSAPPTSSSTLAEEPTSTSPPPSSSSANTSSSSTSSSTPPTDVSTSTAEPELTTSSAFILSSSSSSEPPSSSVAPSSSPSSPTAVSLPTSLSSSTTDPTSSAAPSSSSSVVGTSSLPSSSSSSTTSASTITATTTTTTPPPSMVTSVTSTSTTTRPAGPTAPAATPKLVRAYQGSTFFDGFDFFSDADPTNGLVNYRTAADAFSLGLASVNADGAAVMSIDRTSTLAKNVKRNSVRIESKETYDAGHLVLFDVAHMPVGCSVWPAIWTYNAPWPAMGEIDVVEGVNRGAHNSMTLHTASGCTRNASIPQTGTLGTSSTDCYAYSWSWGCGVTDNDASSYGTGFNAVGGGVFALLFAETGISIWRFRRDSIPLDITNGAPRWKTWGTPVAAYDGSSCDTRTFFQKQMLTFDITTCGDLAGGVFFDSSTSGSCGTTYPGGCADAVMNPAEFAEAYFEVNSVKVYSV